MLRSVLAGAIFVPLVAVEFDRDIRPIMDVACLDCHGPSDPAADLDYTAYATEDALRTHPDLLENMLWSLEEHEMPPRKAERQLSMDERAALVHWLQQTIEDLENANPNDPGHVVVARLNHHEYNYVVRDLTGQDIDAAQFFPRDGGGGEGFPNVGEAQNATPMQVEKFLGAAKFVLRHARFIPQGNLAWNDRIQPTASDAAERIEQLKELWYAWHERTYLQQTDEHRKALQQAVGMEHGAYLEAAWRYHHRAALGEPGVGIAGIAAAYEVPLYPIFLEKWYALLQRDDLSPYLARIAAAWRELPAPDAIADDELRNRCRRLEERAVRLAQQRDLRSQYQPVRALATPTWDQNANKKDWQRAIEEEGRYTLTLRLDRLSREIKQAGRVHVLISPAGDDGGGDVVQIGGGMVALDGKAKETTTFAEAGIAMRVVRGKALGADAASGTLTVQAPAVVAVDLPEAAAMLTLTAGLDPERGTEGSFQVSVSEGEPPADLTELPGRYILSRPEHPQRKALAKPAERLHEALEGGPWIKGWHRTGWVYRGHEAFDGSRLAEVDDRREPSSNEWEVLHVTPAQVRAQARPAARQELDALAAEIAGWLDPPAPATTDERVRELVRRFATRAWRRPIAEDELDGLMALYDAQRDEAFIEQAIRLPLLAVLVDPAFIYRLQDSQRSGDAYVLSPQDLAERLSFALWGSLPDEELAQAAADGSLADPEVLTAQARRMLTDERAYALATDFAGYWLHFEGFDQHTAVDTERYKSFDDNLRDAMYAEVVTFMDHVIRGNAPVTDVLHSDYSFLNEPLAQLYDIAGVEGDELRKVPLPAESHRGGVLTMAALLTKTSKPLRTSPVIRGDWVLQELLGIEMPPPPDNIPLLSDDEVNEEGLTFLEQLQQHREDPACYSCHARLDPIGVAMEQFDPIGRWRSESETGLELTVTDTMPDGTVLDGIQGLRSYLAEREDLFLEHFCKKLVGYCLGRKVLVTDRPLIDDMMQALAANDYRFAAALTTLVQSRQFRMRRDEIDEGQAILWNARP